MGLVIPVEVGGGGGAGAGAYHGAGDERRGCFLVPAFSDCWWRW